MGKVVESITGAVSDAIEDVADFVGGDIVDDILGLESLGEEITRWGDDIGQVVKVLGGNYHTDMKQVQQKAAQIEAFQTQYQNDLDIMIEKTNGLIAFHEIFKLAMSNRIDEYTTDADEVLERLIKEYKSMVAALENEYDFVIGMSNGDFLGPLGQIVGSIVMIVGGLMSDLGDVISGEADGDTWKRVVVAIIAVIVIVVLVMALAAGGLATAEIIAAVLAIASALLTLDGMYANGSMLGAVMSILDFAFNDVLQLNDIIGSDFNKFDSDHEDYKQMAMYVQTAIALAAIYTSFTTEIMKTAISQAGTTLGISASTMAAAGPYMQAYQAYVVANGVNDVVEANRAYKDLKSQFEKDLATLESNADSLRRKNFIKHYKDTSAFLNDQQVVIDNYIWSMTSANMYVDPYATTPVASIRFTPDDEVRGLTFGFEDMFKYDNMGGGSNYFHNILYNTSPTKS